MLQNEGTLSTHERHFPNHNNKKDKGRAGALCLRKKSKKMQSCSLKASLILRNGSRGANFAYIENFYDQMDFSLEQRLVITKVIIELADPSRSLNLTENRLRRDNRFEDGALVSYENDRRDITSYHNHP